MSSAKQVQYKSARDPSLVKTALESGDRVIITTPAGQRTIDPSLLGGTIDIVTWDAAATEAALPLEVIPYTRLHEITYSPEEWTVAPTTNAGKTSLKKLAQTGTDTSVSGQVAGRLPATGKYWFVVTADAGICDPSDDNWAEVMFSRVNTYMDSYGTNLLVGGGFGGTYAWMGSGNGNVADTATTKTYMVCVNIDTGTVDFYNSTGLVKTYTSASSLAGSFIVLAIFVYSTPALAAELTFSVTPADAPFAIPADYLPLVTSGAAAATAIGNINIASSNSILRDYQIVKDRAYYVNDDTAVFELPMAAVTPGLNKRNIFSISQKFNGGLELGNSFQLKTAGNALSVGYDSNTGLFGRLAAATSITYGTVHMSQATGGFNNSVFGHSFANAASYCDSSVMMGYGLQQATWVADTVAVGRDIGASIKKSQGSTLIGANAANMTGYDLQLNTIVGGNAYTGWAADPNGATTPTVLHSNTAVGYQAHYRGVPGSYNTTVGALALNYDGNGSVGTGIAVSTVAMGYATLGSRKGDNSRCVAVGRSAMEQARNSDDSVAVGYQALYGVNGNGNVAVGSGALKYTTIGASTISNCTAVGLNAMLDAVGFTNSSAFGAGATVTGSNQVQLGDSATTTYAYGAVQARSDMRDKTDIRDTELGLNFIRALEPKDWRWDLREDYIDYSTMPIEPRHPGDRPSPPTVDKSDEQFQGLHMAYLEACERYEEEYARYQSAKAAYDINIAEWRYRNSMSVIKPDGTHKRSRFHHGLLAQDVERVCHEQGIDFGGLQNHSLSGGEDVFSLGMTELIGPMIKAIQEVDARIDSQALADKVAEQVTQRLLSDPIVLDRIAMAVLDKLGDK